MCEEFHEFLESIGVQGVFLSYWRANVCEELSELLERKRVRGVSRVIREQTRVRNLLSY